MKYLAVLIVLAGLAAAGNKECRVQRRQCRALCRETGGGRACRKDCLKAFRDCAGLHPQVNETDNGNSGQLTTWPASNISDVYAIPELPRDQHNFSSAADNGTSESGTSESGTSESGTSEADESKKHQQRTARASPKYHAGNDIGRLMDEGKNKRRTEVKGSYSGVRTGWYADKSRMEGPGKHEVSANHLAIDAIHRQLRQVKNELHGFSNLQHSATGDSIASKNFEEQAARDRARLVAPGSKPVLHKIREKRYKRRADVPHASVSRLNGGMADDKKDAEEKELSRVPRANPKKMVNQAKKHVVKRINVPLPSEMDEAKNRQSMYHIPASLKTKRSLSRSIHGHKRSAHHTNKRELNEGVDHPHRKMLSSNERVAEGGNVEEYSRMDNNETTPNLPPIQNDSSIHVQGKTNRSKEHLQKRADDAGDPSLSGSGEREHKVAQIVGNYLESLPNDFGRKPVARIDEKDASSSVEGFDVKLEALHKAASVLENEASPAMKKASKVDSGKKQET